jgi:methylmalonyl-CoA mutase
MIKNRGFKPQSVNLWPGINPVGGFASTGRAPAPWAKLSQIFAALVVDIAGEGFRGPFAVADGRIVHNAGGSEAQELGFVLATGVAYLRALEASGMTLEAARDAIYFRLSADAEQFLTIAKFRAARKLWARVEAECGLNPKPVVITAETAWRMMTRRDAYVNMLRTTIAGAAAGLGGADSITVLPHTAAIGLPDPFARRIARNTQLLLLEESNLARVADPAAGSGAIEAVTGALCAAAWALFQEIEKAGGIWAALESGKFQDGVAAVRAERQKAVARRIDLLTGTNDFPNIHEASATVLVAAPVASANDGATTDAKPLVRIRLAEPFERLRETSDQILSQTGARPKVFLATLGALADFTARANFAKNFFEAGGIEAVGGEAEGSSLVADFKRSGAALACLCASDKTYETEAANAAAVLKSAGAQHIYLAGRPGDHETAHRGAGVGTFIYANGEALATLRAAYDILRDRGLANA